MRLETLIGLGRFAARVLYRFEVHGVENIPTTGPCIVGCNHPGKMLGDMFVVLAMMERRRPTIVAPEQLFQGRMIGRRTRSRGEELTMSIMREGVKLIPTVTAARTGNSAVSQNLALLQALERGEAVFLAVEGEVAWDGRLNPSRNGAPWMALRTGAPIIPCATIGTYDMWPRWEVTPRLSGRVKVRFGKPLQLSQEIPQWIDDKMLEEAGQRIMAEIGKLIE